MPFKIDRFLNSLMDHEGKSAQELLMQNRIAYDTLTTSTQTARWIGSMMEDMAVEISADNARVVMETCGQHCIGISILENARMLQQDSRDIDELLDKLNYAHIGGGKLRREENIIYASYDKCYCGSVSKTRQPISTIYCHCSCGWYKQLFESILNKPVKVELLDSIVHGADLCQFIIHI
jgi:predicted hydrocarbon binding protein